MSKLPVKKWKDFLTSLGVLEFLAVTQKTHTFSRAELVLIAIILCVICCQLPRTTPLRPRELEAKASAFWGQ